MFSIVCLLVVLYLYKRQRKQSYAVNQDDELKACTYVYSYVQIDNYCSYSYYIVNMYCSGKKNRYAFKYSF